MWLHCLLGAGTQFSVGSVSSDGSQAFQDGGWSVLPAKIVPEQRRMAEDAKEKGADCRMNYTYLVLCRDGSLYCGWTNRLAERIKAHNEGKGAKYTRCRRPVELVYYEEFFTKEEAMSREYAIKRLSRRQKLNLIAGFEREEGHS